MTDKIETPLTPEFDLVSFLKNLTERPGVYQMLDADGTILYVGKAKNLKKRVSTYFNKNHQEIKTQAMVEQIASVAVTVTDTESEALILENTLIKRHKPRYNILFRDDKSYPYIYVSTGKTYPSLSYHRGGKKRVGRYFGPFPNAAAVHQTLDVLQKVFNVRQCPESVFRHRSRPCLQYQIKRCSGPCVEGLVTKEQYDEDVQHTITFLEGKSFQVIEELGKKMEEASSEMAFEKAAVYRDKVSALRAVQSQLLINQPGNEEMDVIAVAMEAKQVCVALMMYRGGNLWGSQHSYPKVSADSTLEEILTAFISQHYMDLPVPKNLLIEHKLDEQSGLIELLSKKRGNKVEIKLPATRVLKGLMKLATTNAESGLKQHLTQRASQLQRVTALQDALMLPTVPNTMECFDISHTQGEQTVASCVVFSEGIPNSQAYRKFNIEGITGGDDYAAMYQVIHRRYSRLKNEGKPLPDLVVIDGGKGQLNQAIEVLKELELDNLQLVSVAKGEGRKAGLEILYTPQNPIGIDLQADDMALHLINHIRDEAHRFAITGHRKRRQKAQTHSRLEDISGVGGKTRQKLLMHFGGLADVKNAAVSELQKVPGISPKMAQTIYDFFHGDI